MDKENALKTEPADAKKKASKRATHHKDCGDVGETGEHGDIGSNAANRKAEDKDEE